MKKTVTLGTLDQRMDGLDSKVDGLDKKIDGLDQRMNGFDQRLDGFDQRMNGFDHRMDGLDSKVEKLDKKIGNVEKRLINYVNQRVKLAEKFGHEDLVSELAKFEHRMNDFLDKVIKEVSESREDRVLLSSRVYEHDEQLENHEDRIASLEKQTVTV